MQGRGNRTLNKIRFNVEPRLFPNTNSGNLRLYYELELLKSYYENVESQKHLDRYLLVIDELMDRGLGVDFSTDMKIDKAVKTVKGVYTEDVVQKPFADYEDFDDCVRRNKDKKDPKAYCAEIMRRVEETQKTHGDIHIHLDSDISILSENDEVELEYKKAKLELLKSITKRVTHIEK